MMSLHASCIMYAYHTCPHKIQYTMWKPKDTQDISQRHNGHDVTCAHDIRDVDVHIPMIEQYCQNTFT